MTEIPPAGSMEWSMKLTRRQAIAFWIAMALCGGLLFGIGFSLGIVYPSIVARF